MPLSSVNGLIVYLWTMQKEDDAEKLQMNKRHLLKREIVHFLPSRFYLHSMGCLTRYQVQTTNNYLTSQKTFDQL